MDWRVELENAEGGRRALHFGEWKHESELGDYAQLYLRALTGDGSWATVRADSAPSEEWRIELMNEAGELRTYLYEGWERDEANADALLRAEEETGDASWHTVFIRDDAR
jgi:hypothetical protein